MVVIRQRQPQQPQCHQVLRAQLPNRNMIRGAAQHPRSLPPFSRKLADRRLAASMLRLMMREAT
jgi:hypothetical protein